MAKKKREVYIIHLDGEDTYVKLVDKETFDWLSSDPGRPEGKSSWVDPNVPPAVLARIKKVHGDEVRITSGSWENDRAIFAEAVYGNCDSLKEAFELVRRKNYKVMDTFEGCMY